MKLVTAFALLGAAAASIILLGCAVPTVKYTRFDNSHTRKSPDDVADTYVLSKTMLHFVAAEDQTLKLTAIPSESRDVILGITPISKFGVTTSVTLTKAKDSDLVAAVSSSVEDKRSEYVKSVGSLLGSIVTLGAASSKGESNVESACEVGSCLIRSGNEIIVDTYELIKQNSTAGTDSRQASNYILKEAVGGVIIKLGSISVGAVPPDALLLDDDVIEKASHVFLYSACRPASIDVVDSNNKAAHLSFRLADPRYVEMVAFPTKGKLTAQDSCGVSVTSETPSTESNVDVAKSVVDQLKDLADQLKKQKKP